MKDIFRIFLALVIIVTTVVVIDYVFGYITDKFFFSSIQTKFSYALNSQYNPDLVFFGSSRAENHYDTPFINDSLHVDAFNLGEAGRGLTYHKAAIIAYLKKHSPKTIILELVPDELKGDLNNRIKPLYIYVDSFPEIRQIARDVNPLNQYLLNSRLYRYNSQIFDYIKKYRHPFNPDGYGFVPLKLSNSYKDVLSQKIIDRTYRIDIISKKCLIDITNACKYNNVRLVVAYSPEFTERDYEIPMTAICDSLGVQVIDARDFRPSIPGNQYFYDNFHLNKNGAREYTRHFMRILDRDSAMCNNSASQ